MSEGWYEMLEQGHGPVTCEQFLFMECLLECIKFSGSLRGEASALCLCVIRGGLFFNLPGII